MLLQSFEKGFRMADLVRKDTGADMLCFAADKRERKELLRGRAYFETKRGKIWGDGLWCWIFATRKSSNCDLDYDVVESPQGGCKKKKKQTVPLNCESPLIKLKRTSGRDLAVATKANAVSLPLATHSL